MNRWRFSQMKITTRSFIKYLAILSLFIIFIMRVDIIWGRLLQLFSVAQPMLNGFILAYIVNILVSIIEPYLFPHTNSAWLSKLKRPLAIFLAILAIGAVVILLFSLVLPQLINVISTFASSIPSFLDSLLSKGEEISTLIPGGTQWLETLEIDWAEISKNLVSSLNGLGQSILSSTIATISSVAMFVVNTLLSFIISIYVLANKEKLMQQVKRLTWTNLSEIHFEKISYTTHLLNDSFKQFISGQVLEAVILGSLIGLGMWLFQFPYALMIGVLTAVLSLIPYIGPLLAAGIGFILIFVESPLQAVWFIIFVVIVQQIEGNLIYPKIVGNALGLPSLWVLISTTIGGSLFGIPGFLIGLPFASFLYRLLANSTRYKEEQKKSDYPNNIQPPYKLSAETDYHLLDIHYQ